VEAAAPIDQDVQMKVIEKEIVDKKEEEGKEQALSDE
jgi:hypothetical protein